MRVVNNTPSAQHKQLSSYMNQTLDNVHGHYRLSTQQQRSYPSIMVKSNVNKH